MVLIRKAHPGEIPKDAIILTENEAADMVDAHIQKQSYFEVWPVRFSSPILGISTAYSSFAILAKFRRKLKLLNYGLYALSIPFSILPAYGALFANHYFIKRPIMLQNECSVCLLTRSAVYQACFSTVIPAVLGGMVSLRFAHTFATYTLPPNWPFKRFLLMFWKDVVKLNKPHSNFLAGILAGNLILAAVLLKLEEDTMVKVNEQIYKEEYEKARRMYKQEKMRRDYKV